MGDSIETFLVGNAPAGHWPEPGAPENGGKGGTNFYHRAQWLEGDLRLTEKYSDFMWLTKVRRARCPRARKRTARSRDFARRRFVFSAGRKGAARLRAVSFFFPSPPDARSPLVACPARLDLEMTNVTLSITGLLSTDAHLTALSDTYVA